MKVNQNTFEFFFILKRHYRNVFRNPQDQSGPVRISGVFVYYNKILLSIIFTRWGVVYKTSKRIIRPKYAHRSIFIIVLILLRRTSITRRYYNIPTATWYLWVLRNVSKQFLFFQIVSTDLTKRKRCEYVCVYTYMSSEKNNDERVLEHFINTIYYDTYIIICILYTYGYSNTFHRTEWLITIIKIT